MCFDAIQAAKTDATTGDGPFDARDFYGVCVGAGGFWTAGVLRQVCVMT